MAVVVLVRGGTRGGNNVQNHHVTDLLEVYVCRGKNPPRLLREAPPLKILSRVAFGGGRGRGRESVDKGVHAMHGPGTLQEDENLPSAW